MKFAAHWVVIWIAVAASSVSSCFTVGDHTGMRLTSPYLRPSEGIFYHYGNFCGAQFPSFPEGESVEARIRIINSLRPVDSIDRACKGHDLCYEMHGHDEDFCDNLFFYALNQMAPNEGSLARATLTPLGNWQGDTLLVDACIHLIHEMENGVVFLKPRRVYNGNEDSGRLGRQRAAGLGIVGLGMATDVVDALAGFPSRPGLCHQRHPYNFRAQSIPID